MSGLGNSDEITQIIAKSISHLTQIEGQYMLVKNKIRQSQPLIGKNWLKALPLITSAALVGCFDSSSDVQDAPPANLITLDMALPNSLTGGQNSQTGNSSLADGSAIMSRSSASGEAIEISSRNGSGAPCSYLGADEEDPFRNGYEMTKFMVGAMGTWTCIADTLIEVAGFVEQDGTIYETDNIAGSASYKEDDPTHFSVSADTETQTSIRLYYGFEQATPPTADEDAGFYLGWDTAANGDVNGRLVIDNTVIKSNPVADDPSQMRLDFEITENERISDMYLRFPEDNIWAEGLRIKVTRDLNANPLEQVFVAQGLMEMRDQFFAADGITEVPRLKMFTVSDQLGEGAAIAEFEDINLPLILTATNNLGNHLTTKTDKYFFEADGDWDYINKTFTVATLASGRTTPATGGTWLPFDPSLDMLVDVAEFGLGLDSDYFTNGKCENPGDSCLEMINGIYDADAGWDDQEPNQGTDPQDWRSSAVVSPTYLDTVFPNGTDWAAAFDMNL